ncbi:hydroxyisourate hydrolase [Yaniella halotolerans]|uniref:hydroxyisourate hydrolase n=1 Tax=Yaniella halotolerans TaxID=225453 RepID=UPI0003B50171|nr:hydroxyisourate hydrolase [Yaniella halotolerans]
MSFVTAHILDASLGTPAPGVTITLQRDDNTEIAQAVTNADGRVPELGPETLEAGVYRITFGTGEYFSSRNVETFYPSVIVNFTVEPGQKHYHIPLLLSPFAYSTYRGS